MPTYHFPGYPAFLRGAADRMGRPELAGRASRSPALAAMANLCAQAAEAEPAHVVEILTGAGEFLDQLEVAHEAAKLMLESVSEGLGVDL